MTRKSELIAAVNELQLGKRSQRVKNGGPGKDLIDFIKVENYAEKRKAASGEADFVHLLILDILPALHCHHLLSESKSYIDIREEFKTQKQQDKLLWLLLFMVQTVRKHVLPWNVNPLPPEDQVIAQKDQLLSIERLE